MDLYWWSEWLLTASINRLVLAIKSIETDETLERWQFEIHTDEAAAAGGKPSTLVGRTESGGKKKEKTEKEVQGEIREIMKQITSTTTFLPILQEECKCFLWSEICSKVQTGISADMQAHSHYWPTRMNQGMWLYHRRGEMQTHIWSIGVKSNPSDWGVSAQTSIHSK
jgi:mitotic spindle assembly checkpoint protein MAD2